MTANLGDSSGGAGAAGWTESIAEGTGAEGADPWLGVRDAAHEGRGRAPAAPRVHRRFDPVIARRDALARISASIASRQAAIRSKGGPGHKVRLRLVLELDGLREAERAIREFDGAGLAIVARVEAANLLQEISLLDPKAPTFREELFRLRQRLYGISAGCLPDDRLLGIACMAIRVLEDAARRLLSGRPAAIGHRVPCEAIRDEQAEILEEQRIHAIWGMLGALGRIRLAGLEREGVEAVMKVLRRVDPLAFGFDPRNQRFVRHVGELLDKVSKFAA